MNRIVKDVFAILKLEKCLQEIEGSGEANANGGSVDEEMITVHSPASENKTEVVCVCGKKCKSHAGLLTHIRRTRKLP